MNSTKRQNCGSYRAGPAEIMEAQWAVLIQTRAHWSLAGLDADKGIKPGEERIIRGPRYTSSL